MSNDVNTVCVTGRLVRDAELRTTQAGTHVLGFSIASNYQVKNASTGVYEDRANFFDCTLIGTRAERLAQMMFKGQRVAISGSLRYQSWERDGQKRSKVEIFVDSVVLCDRMDGDSQQVAPVTPQNAPTQPNAAYAMPNPNMPPNAAQNSYQQAQRIQQAINNAQPTYGQPYQGNYQQMGFQEEPIPF